MLSMSMIIHPEYQYEFTEYLKWRLTYIGGKRFLDLYLQRFSTRETDADFLTRMGYSYVPAFAKVGINEIRDSLYNRMIDITRDGGSESYQSAMAGYGSGVDLLGSSMNYFMGVRVLPELLTMRKVGLYVDMPSDIGPSISDNKNVKPYIYLFPVEDVRSWVFDESSDSHEFSSILLRESIFTHDEETGFPNGQEERYRRLWRGTDGLINAAFYNAKDEMVDKAGFPLLEPIPMNITKIPFMILDLGESLLTDIADMQIALMNLQSADMSFIMKANQPMYIEQVDARQEALKTRPPSTQIADVSQSRIQNIQTGIGKGRQYGLNLDPPAFIHPSPEPLMASMKKQEQVKEEIRNLLKLAVSNLKPPVMASADSKKQDTRSLENGLGYIGLILEHAERKVAEFWHMYEQVGEQATVHYPSDYKLISEVDRRAESDHLQEIQDKIPSQRFQKEVQKRIAKITLGRTVGCETLAEIEQQIEDAPATLTDPDLIFKSAEAGLCGNELASKILGFPDGEHKRAETDHANRLARIAISQSQGAAAAASLPSDIDGARGVSDLDVTPGQTARLEKKESTDTTMEAVTAEKVRGGGLKV